MKKFKEVMFKLVRSPLFNSLALIAAIGSVNVACGCVHHQPEVPNDLKSFRKF